MIIIQYSVMIPVLECHWQDLSTNVHIPHTPQLLTGLVTTPTQVVCMSPCVYSVVSTTDRWEFCCCIVSFIQSHIHYEHVQCSHKVFYMSYYSASWAKLQYPNYNNDAQECQNRKFCWFTHHMIYLQLDHNVAIILVSWIHHLAAQWLEHTSYFFSRDNM